MGTVGGRAVSPRRRLVRFLLQHPAELAVLAAAALLDSDGTGKNWAPDPARVRSVPLPHDAGPAPADQMGAGGEHDRACGLHGTFRPLCPPSRQRVSGVALLVGDCGRLSVAAADPAVVWDGDPALAPVGH